MVKYQLMIPEFEWDPDKVNPVITETSNQFRNYLTRHGRPGWESIYSEELDDLWDPELAAILVRKTGNITFEALGPFRTQFDFKTRGRIIVPGPPALILTVTYPNPELTEPSLTSGLMTLNSDLAKRFHLALGAGDYAKEGLPGRQYNFRFMEQFYSKP